MIAKIRINLFDMVLLNLNNYLNLKETMLPITIIKTWRRHKLICPTKTLALKKMIKFNSNQIKVVKSKA